MFKKGNTWLLEKTLKEIESFHYVEQFLNLSPDFFSKNLPISGLSLFFLNNDKTVFMHYFEKKHSGVELLPITWNSNLVTHLKNSTKPIFLRDNRPSLSRFLKKTNPDLFEKMKVDIIIPLFSLKRLFGFIAIEANSTTYRRLEQITGFFKIFANILIPLIVSERIGLENDRNYYKIYRKDRLAMVGELAASAAHEIKNPLAGISTFLRYFLELKDFKKKDIIDEIQIMRESIQRIDDIIKSLLSFSRYEMKKISKISLKQAIESSLHSIAVKIPPNINVVIKIEENFLIETDAQRLRQVLVNILFNSIEAIDNRGGVIFISTYVSGRDKLPSRELFNISLKDNGPGIEESFKENIFQPFHTTKDEGTGLGLYTCYGLMKSLGGNIEINSSGLGTEVILSLPYSFEDEEE